MGLSPSSFAKFHSLTSSIRCSSPIIVYVLPAPVCPLNDISHVLGKDSGGGAVEELVNEVFDFEERVLLGAPRKQNVIKPEIRLLVLILDSDCLVLVGWESLTFRIFTHSSALSVASIGLCRTNSRILF